MTIDDAHNRFNADVAAAAAAADAYYHGAAPVMSDADYDTLIDRITAAAEHPEWDTRGLLDKVAGGTAARGDVTHPEPMLSLSKTVTLNDVATFTETLGDTVIVEPKMDGLAVRAEYCRGRLTLVATRGDGRTGENVTATATDIFGLPAELSSPVDVQVRGEVYMTDLNFEEANSNRIAAGEPGYANPRNAVAGALRREASTYATPMSFAAYDVSGTPFTQDSYPERMSAAETYGIGTALSLARGTVTDADTATGDPAVVRNRIDELHTARATLGYPIDGAVIKCAHYRTRTDTGESARHPRWATSYKYAADTTITVVEDVELSIGRTGRLGIRLRVTPATVGGATITYASGHNVSWMLDQKMGIGTKVWLYRAGDVIPRAVALPDEAQPENVTPWTPPDSCPQCGGEWDTSSLLWRCHTPTCSQVGALTYFCSRDAMDIMRIGEQVAEALVAEGYVTNPADLYHLDAARLAELPMGTTATGSVRRLGKANADAIIAEVDASKAQPFNRVLTALGIRMTGRTVGRWLAATYPTMDALRAASVDEVAAIDGLGPIKAAHIVDGLAANADLIDALAAAGVNMGTEPNPDGAVEAPLAGGTYVVSGSVPGYTRTTIAERIENLGGKSSGTVSKNTTALVTDRTDTAKARKAAELGIPVIDPATFATMLAEQP